jgi:hypothetical protein
MGKAFAKATAEWAKSAVCMSHAPEFAGDILAGRLADRCVGSTELLLRCERYLLVYKRLSRQGADSENRTNRALSVG